MVFRRSVLWVFVVVLLLFILLIVVFNLSTNGTTGSFNSNGLNVVVGLGFSPSPEAAGVLVNGYWFNSTYYSYVGILSGWGDMCTMIAQQLGVLNYPSLNSIVDGYFDAYGIYAVSDSANNGVFIIDYCIEVANFTVNGKDGTQWVPMWVYNFVAYLSNSPMIKAGGYILRIQIYQDAYSSYECYVNSDYIPPDGLCESFSMPRGYATVVSWWPRNSIKSSILSLTSGLDESVITPLGNYAGNITWTFRPSKWVARQGSVHFVSSFMAVALPSGNSTTQVIVLPVGSSVLVYLGRRGVFPFICRYYYELWVSRIEWVIFWPRSPSSYNLINAYVVPLPVSNAHYFNGGIYMISWSKLGLCLWPFDS